jgi:hypothetical protein
LTFLESPNQVPTHQKELTKEQLPHSCEILITNYSKVFQTQPQYPKRS